MKDQYFLDIANSDTGQKIVELWRNDLGVEAIASKVKLQPKDVRMVLIKLGLNG